MFKPIWFTDIDSTIILNSKDTKYLDESKYHCVSYKCGKPSGFMSVQNFNLLQEIQKRCMVVPVTSRCLSSYMDIHLGFTPELALIENGAILLDGYTVSKTWINESEKLLEPYMNDYSKIREYLISRGYTEKWGSTYLLDFHTRSEKSEIERMEIQEHLSKYEGIQSFVGKSSVIVTHTMNRKEFNIGRLVKYIKICPKRKIIVSGDSQADWGMLAMTTHSYGLDDSPAYNKFNKEEFDEHLENFLDWVMYSVYCKT